MAEFYVERQPWAHWPKVLIMGRKTGNGADLRRRYVPDAGKCKMDPYTDVSFTVCQAPEVNDFEEYAGVCECSNCGSSFIIPNYWDSVTPQSEGWNPWPRWECCPVCMARIEHEEGE